MSVMFISIFVLPFVALAFGSIVFAIVRSLTGTGSPVAGAPAPAAGRRSWGAGFAIAVAVVIGVLLLAGALGTRLVAPQVHVASETRIAQSVVAPLPPAAYEWENSISREPSLPRDPHTSMKTLKAYMAASVESALNGVGEGARKVWVVADEGVPQELALAIRKEIKAQSPKSKSSPSSSSAADDVTPADAVVRVRWEEPPSSVSVPWWPQPMLRGTLVADVTAPRGEECIKARLEEKPWLGPGPYGRRDQIIVTSGGPTAPTREEAVHRLNQAKTVAVGNLVEPQVAALSSQWHARPDDVRTQVMARYGDAGTPFDDQVVMRIDRPLGPVWYAAGIVRVPTSDVSRMAQAAQSVSYDRRDGWARMLGGAAGMLLVLLVLYAFMNAITRGYFRAHLRTAVAIVLALAVVMMFLRIA